jgi:hypothetical protein
VVFLDVISVVSIVAAVVVAPLALLGWSNILAGVRSRGIAMKSTVVFVVLIIVGLLSGAISTSIGEYRLGAFLDSASPNCTVSIDGQVLPSPRAVLDALRRVGHLPAHHSSPGRILDVVIADPPRKLSLWIARDSSDPREYWVFFPSPSKLAYRARLKTDIGHVKTNVFDGYGT